MHSPFEFMHLTHQNLSVSALFCNDSLAKVNMQSLIYTLDLVHVGYVWCAYGYSYIHVSLQCKA